jgi:hypothetical protein
MFYGNRMRLLQAYRFLPFETPYLRTYSLPLKGHFNAAAAITSPLKSFQYSISPSIIISLAHYPYFKVLEGKHLKGFPVQPFHVFPLRGNRKLKMI